MTVKLAAWGREGRFGHPFCETSAVLSGWRWETAKEAESSNLLDPPRTAVSFLPTHREDPHDFQTPFSSGPATELEDGGGDFSHGPDGPSTQEESQGP